MIPNVTGRARLGINAAKRYIKHSVDRNRFKRITREVFRQHSITLLPVDIFISLRSAIVCPMDKQWNKALREELLKLLSMATHRIAK
jgi:ribonuclease P protein component